MDQAALYLAVTVRAYQYALLGLLAKLGKALTRGDAKSKGRGRIDMMEVQVDHAPVVSADRAASARLCHKDALDLLEAPRDSLSDAAVAAPSGCTFARAVVMKHHKAMAPAVAQRRGALRLGRPALLRDQRHRRYGFCAWHEHMFAITADAKNAIMRTGPLAQWQSAGLQHKRSASRETASWSAAVCWDALRASGTEA